MVYKKFYFECVLLLFYIYSWFQLLIPICELNQLNETFKTYLVGLNENSALKGMTNTDLFNIRDTILGDMNQFLYLLTFK